MSTEPRSVVTKRIAAQFKRFPSVDITPLLVDSLDSRDAGLARAIDHAIHRRWYSLAEIISHASNRKLHTLDANVGATLLVATAQLLLLDKIPDHAVIHNAVEWIKTTGSHPRAAGFVNAVLRTITRLRSNKIEKGELGNGCHFLRGDGSAWELHEPVFKDNKASQVGFSQKVWKRIQEEFGDELANTIALNSLVEPPIIVTTEGKSLPECLLPTQNNAFKIVPDTVSLSEILSEDTTIRVQDRTSAASLSLTNGLHPRRILDVCAGRGTKTKQLRGLFPQAMIGATEPNEHRRSSLLAVAKDFDIHVYTQDSEGPSEPFDLVVVDVPCSNSGVFARRPEAKYRYTKKNIDSVIELQREIVTEALEVLGKGGYILYATCSIDDAENEGQAQWLASKKYLQQIQELRTLPSGAPGSDPATWHDGGYAVLLQKT